MKKTMILFCVLLLFACDKKVINIPEIEKENPIEKPIDKPDNSLNGFGKYAKYTGSFALPVVVGDGKWDELIEDAGDGIAYNPKNHSLFVTSHVYANKIVEVSIPEEKITLNYSELNKGQVLQSSQDPTDGKRRYTGIGGQVVDYGVENGIDNEQLAGLLVTNDSLVGTVYSVYANALKADLSHYKSSTDLSIKDDVKSMVKVGEPGAGFVADYMGHIPTKYQSILRGKYVTGMACKSIVSRTSFGPSLSVFNPDEFILDPNYTNPTIPLVYYPETNTTLGDYYNKGQVYNMATEINGVFFSNNSVVFVGRNGIGEPLYGSGTRDKTLHKVKRNDEHIWVYDPVYPEVHGPHAYPYRYWYWSYSISDMDKVVKGEKKPWEVRPKEDGAFDLEFDKSTEIAANLGGITNTPDGKKVYILQQKAYKNLPVVHVYELYN